MASNRLDKAAMLFQEEFEKRFDSEFERWKKYILPFSYDVILHEPVKWSSLTVHWSPTPSSAASSQAKLLYGNFIPAPGDALLTFADVDLITERVKKSQKLFVEGIGRKRDMVGRARFMPQQEKIIGVKMRRMNLDDVDEVLVFDSTKFTLQDDQNYKVAQPELRLIGSGLMNLGLSWSPFNEGCILSGSIDDITLWDLSALPHHLHRTIFPIHVFKENGKVRDVQWHSLNKDLFGYVSDKDGVVVKDSRSNQIKFLIKDDHEHTNISFNPYKEWLLATGSAEKTVDLFDMRMQREKMLSFCGHQCGVARVEWDPNHEDILASAGLDGAVILWDQRRFGRVKDKCAVEDYYKNDPSELMFRHAGHTEWLRDISRNKNVPWLISSVAEDQTLQVWKIAESAMHVKINKKRKKDYLTSSKSYSIFKRNRLAFAVIFRKKSHGVVITSSILHMQV
ncbi:WD-40 repeat-containing protein MSI2-like [Humulus lupulus]|uniref:WD-40 repeat-containing protein MSI2-like n=1 Tax=Humulus lupulus TaxID=3486 RepID=UPI002B416A1D|nr:WD-40 repeat-containing protein MSI2-like [Humulus lupulus]